MDIKKDFTEELRKSYIFDKKKNRAIVAGIATVGSTLEMGFIIWALLTHQPDLMRKLLVIMILISGAIYCLCSAYFFFSREVNLEKEKARLISKIEEKNTQKRLCIRPSRKNKLQKKIWEMEFDLKVIGGSVSE